MDKGIDVSEFQNSIRWDRVKDSVEFAIIRAGYGQNNIDQEAAANVLGCEANNIPYGLYWFSYAYTPEMARREAQYLISFIDGHKPNYPLYFDFEYDSERYANKNGVTVTRELLNQMATAFCEELEKAGYYAGIYANEDYIDKYGQSIFNRYDLWLARWSSNTGGRSVNLWQSSSDGSVDGVDGAVDIDYAFIDFPTLMEEKGLNGHGKEHPFVCPHKCPYCSHSHG